MTVIANDVVSAHNFFEPIRLWKGPLSAQMVDVLADAPPVTPTNASIFTTGPTGLASVISTQPQVSADLQKALDTQQQNLTDLTGVASAYVRNQASVQKNPNLVYDTDLWQGVYNHLPLMAESQFVQQTYNESLKGVEVATSFIELILGFATGAGPALSAFSTFLGGLGQSIKAGVKSTGQAYHSATIGIVLDTQVVGGETQVVPSLKAYFIDFTESEQTVYSSCASAESYNMSFQYRYCESVFNYGALADKEVAKQFNAFIHGTQIDDVKNAQNFFGNTFPKTS